MYRPPANVVHDEQQVREFVAGVGSGEIVSTGPDGYPEATLLPIVWTGERIVAHLAIANPHWRHLDGAKVLVVVTATQAYVSPGWYAAKAEHGRVVPTWNYESVHLRGTARIFDDADRLRSVVEELTDVHERGRAEPWSVADAPERFVSGQLRGIVGLEVVVDDVQAKAKLSQNRSLADRRGVVEGLAGGTPHQRAVAERMVAGQPDL